MDGLYEFYNQRKDLWFKLQCFYYAQTELYDRTLTDLRSPYDKTEAYLSTSTQRRLSNANALGLHKYVSELADYFRIPHSLRKTKVVELWTAQRWIDEYNHIVETGEMDFMNKI